MRAVCCTAALRPSDNPNALSRMEVDDEVSLLWAVPAGFTVGELTVLDRYRRRTFA